MSNPLCPKTERERDEARAERDRLVKALEAIQITAASPGVPSLGALLSIESIARHALRETA